MGFPFFAWESVLSHGRCLGAQRLAAQRELLSRLCTRISTDVEPDQMARTSETKREAGDRGIKTELEGDGDMGQTQACFKQHEDRLTFSRPRLFINSHCIDQNPPAGPEGQWPPFPLTSI